MTQKLSAPMTVRKQPELVGVQQQVHHCIRPYLSGDFFHIHQLAQKMGIA
jgi:hypothetical protein